MNLNVSRNFIFRLTVILLLIAIGCNKGGQEPEDTKNRSLERIPGVEVTKVNAAPFIKKISLTGVLRAKTEVTVSAEEGGILTEILFVKGDSVKKGEILARLDDLTLKAMLAEVQAAYELENLNYERLKTLKDKAGAVSDFDLTSARLKKNMAAARVNVIKTRLAKAYIKAPLAGVVDKKFIEQGELLPPGAPVAKLMDISVLNAEAAITESEIVFFTKGVDAELTVGAYPDKIFAGKVNFISPAADDNSGSFAVEIPVGNPGGILRPGMLVRIALIKERCEKCIIIPQDAIINERSGNFVFLLGKDSRVIKRKIYPGDTQMDKAVIRKGLSEGELVITSGHQNIVDGELVKVSE